MARRRRKRKQQQVEENRTRPSGQAGLPVLHFILLAVLTFAVFGQVTSHSFLNYDDGQFIYENEHVSRGLTPSSIGWALTSSSIGWYPLTWMSHMLDVDLWEQRAGMHAMTSVVLHLLSACILFLAVRRMTGATWPATAVAALFAVHPMHVESVAWVSERKDTLSTLFIMLTLLVYAISPKHRWLLFVTMALSMMAKQMYVTLPFVLLLLDFWPLGRIQTMRELRACTIEKIPLFALSIFGAIMAVIGQRNLAALQSTETTPWSERLSNAPVAYLRYIAKFFVPIDLAVFYPAQPIAVATAIASAILLLVISIAAFHYRKTVPYFFTGWFWFVGTLVPVIGIVQIGVQAIADRYTYFSYIGLSIAVIWGTKELARRARMPDSVPASIGVIAVAALAATSYRQVGYWQDSETLFAHTISITPPNALAEYSLGQTLEMREPDRALAHLRRAIELVEKKRGGDPAWHAQVYVGVGTALLMKAQPMPAGAARVALINESIAQNQRALAIDPNAPHAKYNIDVAHQWLGH